MNLLDDNVADDSVVGGSNAVSSVAGGASAVGGSVAAVGDSNSGSDKVVFAGDNIGVELVAGASSVGDKEVVADDSCHVKDDNVGDDNVKDGGVDKKTSLGDDNVVDDKQIFGNDVVGGDICDKDSTGADNKHASSSGDKEIVGDELSRGKDGNVGDNECGVGGNNNASAAIVHEKKDAGVSKCKEVVVVDDVEILEVDDSTVPIAKSFPYEDYVRISQQKGNKAAFYRWCKKKGFVVESDFHDDVLDDDDDDSVDGSPPKKRGKFTGLQGRGRGRGSGRGRQSTQSKKSSDVCDMDLERHFDLVLKIYSQSQELNKPALMDVDKTEVSGDAIEQKLVPIKRASKRQVLVKDEEKSVVAPKGSKKSLKLDVMLVNEERDVVLDCDYGPTEGKHKKKRKGVVTLVGTHESLDKPVEVDTVPKCQPSTLYKVIKRLTDRQKDAVKEIGFGGLLHLKLSSFPRSMIRTLYRNFLANKRMLIVGEHKTQIYTSDVYDVFGIPYGDLKVKESGKNEYLELKNYWRRHYGNGVECQVSDLVRLMFANDERKSGDDVFKKMFIMLALCSVLTPSLNTRIHYKLLHIVDDLKNVKKYDWCLYVLDHLGASAAKYSDNAKYVPGCSLLLQICYLHRYLFRGMGSPRTTPLIQHWTEKGMRDRIDAQEGEYSGSFLDPSYPITPDKYKKKASGAPLADVVEVRNEKSGDIQEIGIKEVELLESERIVGGLKINVGFPVAAAGPSVTGVSSAAAASVSADDVAKGPSVAKGRYVTFVLPDDILTDEEILVNCKDEFERNYLHLQRNVKLFSFLLDQNVKCMRSSLEEVSKGGVEANTKQKHPFLS